MEPVSSHSALGYLARVATVLLGWAVFSIALTVLVDPYRTYGTPTLSGWTELKPRIYQQSGIAKTSQLERVAPKTLLLGNSRVEIGFDPDSKVWPAAYKPVFNGAVAGTGLPTSLAMLRDSIAVRPPQTVFLGVDFQDFLTRQDTISTSPPGGAPDERRLLVARQGDRNRGRVWQVWRDRFATTLTFDALSDSVLTLIDQDPMTTVTMTRSGFNPLQEYSLYAQRVGYYGLFRAKNNDYQQQYSKYRMPDFSKPDRLANFHDLAAIVSLAREHHIKLVLFTHAYHAEYLEMLHRRGLWPSFEQWKHSLAEFASGANVPLYDFAEYDAFTTEQVPRPNDTAHVMRWYWEPGHYKSALGDEVLKAMIYRTGSFGRTLKPENEAEAMQEVRSQRASYLSHRGGAGRKPIAVRQLMSH